MFPLLLKSQATHRIIRFNIRRSPICVCECRSPHLNFAHRKKSLHAKFQFQKRNTATIYSTGPHFSRRLLVRFHKPTPVSAICKPSSLHRALSLHSTTCVTFEVLIKGRVSQMSLTLRQRHARITGSARTATEIAHRLVDTYVCVPTRNCRRQLRPHG